MRLVIPLLVGLLVAPTVAAPPKGRDSTRSAADWAEVFDDPARNDWQKPVLVLGSVPIVPGDRVADLGAGTGYFTEYLATQVGESGHVFAADIDQGMLDYLRNRDDIEQHRVTTILSQADNPMLPEGQIDIVLVVNTWHHIKSRTSYIKTLESALRPGGRVVIIDFYARDLPVGPKHKKVPSERVIKEFAKAGWSLVAESVLLPYQYFLTFHPPPSGETPAFLTESGD